MKFEPPAVGNSYVDPTFSIKVKWLTDSGKGYLNNSEISYFNVDDTYFIATDNNVAYLFDGRTGQKIKRR